MGNTLSSSIIESTPEVTKRLTFDVNKINSNTTDALLKVALVAAKFDADSRLVKGRVVPSTCFGRPKDYTFGMSPVSGVQALELYHNLKKVEPMKIDRKGCCEAEPTSYLDNILYAKAVQVTTTSDDNCCCCTPKDIALLKAAPLCCPCILLALSCRCLIFSCCCCCRPRKKEEIKISSFEIAFSLMLSFRGIANYVEQSPSKRGCCCCSKSQHFDKQVVIWMFGFQILDLIDDIFLASIVSPGTLEDVQNALTNFLTTKEDLDKYNKKAADF